MVAPADEVVHEDVIALDYDVNHSWWVPDLGGKYDAIPGTRQHDLVQGAGRRLRRALRRALRHPARADGRRPCTSCRARSTTRSSRQRAASAAGSPRSATRSGRASARSATGSTTPYIGPALGGQPAARRPPGHRDAPAERPRQMPAVGKNWTDAQIDALDRVHEAVRDREASVDGRQRRERPPVPRRLAPRQGRVVADDGRPQAHRDPLHLARRSSSSRSAACSRC